MAASRLLPSYCRGLGWRLLAFFLLTAGVWVGGFLPSSFLLPGFGLVASRPQHPSAGPTALHPSQKIQFFASMIVSTPVDQGVNRRFSPWTPSSYLATPRCAAEKEQGVQRANHGFALCPAGAGKRVSRNLKFRRRVQGPGGSCRGVLGARSHQLQFERQIPETKKIHCLFPLPDVNYKD